MRIHGTLKELILMPAKNFVIYKVTPKDIEKIDEMEKEVKTIKSGEVKDVKRVPIGFGIEIIKVGVIVDANDDSAIERVAQELAGLETVEDAEQESMTLL